MFRKVDEECKIKANFFTDKPDTSSSTT